jgi:sulfatase modifying factor 1
MTKQLDGIGMEFVEIPGGEFWMGLEMPPDEAAARFGGAADWYVNEQPRHRVRLTRGFWLGMTHVTRGQFARFVSESGYVTEAEKEGFAQTWNGMKFEKTAGRCWRDVGFEQTDDHPAVCVSYADATAFCEWLSAWERKRCRLPSEAEWEYAYRAGTAGAYPWGDDPNAGGGWANAADQTAKETYPEWNVFGWADGFVFTSPVGTFRPNAWGLFDMAGNAWEWCADWFGVYGAEDVVDPTGPATGEKRVLRGGSWFGAPLSCRAAYRSRVKENYRGSNAGFRVAMDL